VLAFYNQILLKLFSYIMHPDRGAVNTWMPCLPPSLLAR